MRLRRRAVVATTPWSLGFHCKLQAGNVRNCSLPRGRGASIAGSCRSIDCYYYFTLVGKVRPVSAMSGRK